MHFFSKGIIDLAVSTIRQYSKGEHYENYNFTNTLCGAADLQACASVVCRDMVLTAAKIREGLGRWHYTLPIGVTT